MEEQTKKKTGKGHMPAIAQRHFLEVVSLTHHRPEFKHVIQKCKEKWEVKAQPESGVFLLRKKERIETEFSAMVEPFG